MELTQLKMFKMIVDQGSIIRASESMHCVPSNITTRIKTLEQELGTPLFIRQGRGLVISPTGKIFYDYVNKILSLCDEAYRAVQPTSIPTGPLKIGAIESSATSRLPQILAQYHQQYPDVQLQFNTGTWDQLLHDVIQHKLDGAIIAVDQQHQDIHRLAIYKEELVLIASSSLGEFNQAQDLFNQNIFMWPEGCPYRKIFCEWLNQHHITAPIISIASYSTILGCVSAGAGVSLLPRAMYEQFKAIGNINAYPLEQLNAVQNYLVWNKNTGVHCARNAFIDLLKQQFL
ncbi:LysR family transcriptional regulator [Acinetobacter qingfengensis]|uniref:LysR family transcriptional regulator n=1 Tax=Acinetobacter qingfengensis TaxID=1262585 RepID=A0A1E7R4Z1_9GAMM|nr:LysR family transcriptional regulator [Acinetobacter qingfengensis]KAA8732444.1 LysR family transcriptional regulator [Acinetobacter qingfengensis]OEY94439.1 LysR family transcriptional regulator [Acinetobacter qingfengensis]